MQREEQKLESIPVVPTQRGPGVDGVPLDVSYSDRGPRDVVLSGPLGFKLDGTQRTGRSGERWFPTEYEMLVWARGKYGEDRVRLVASSLPPEEQARWAVLVRNLKNG